MTKIALELLVALCAFWETSGFVLLQHHAPTPTRRIMPSTTRLDVFASIVDLFAGPAKKKKKMEEKKSPITETLDTIKELKRMEQRLADVDQSLSSLVESYGTSLITSFPNEIRDRTSTEIVHGGSLKTWTYGSPFVERVNVVLGTQGRPLEADIELWQGPHNTPQKVLVYAEDGLVRPFSTIIETPHNPNTIAIRNTGQLEFPMSAHVVADTASTSSTSPAKLIQTTNSAATIQGGALCTFQFDCNVESVQVLLKTEGRPLTARIELMQGPNNNKQIIELYSENGSDRPFFVIIETPGSGDVVRLVNTATVEFPLMAWVEPYMVGSKRNDPDPHVAVLGGDSRDSFMSSLQR